MGAAIATTRWPQLSVLEGGVSRRRREEGKAKDQLGFLFDYAQGRSIEYKIVTANVTI